MQFIITLREKLRYYYGNLRKNPKLVRVMVIGDYSHYELNGKSITMSVVLAVAICAVYLGIFPLG